MSTETDAYIERLDYLTDEFKKALQGISAEELDWVPLSADSNSACVLATHAAGTQSAWIHQIVGGIDINRSRDAEFAAKGATVDELVALLDRTASTSRTVIDGLSTADLHKVHETADGQRVSTRWAILHTLEHIAQHLGHLTLTRQLYAQKNG